MSEPDTIFAMVHGASTDVISGQRGLIGGWVEHERPAHVAYVRADLLATARAEARNAALEEAVVKLEMLAEVRDKRIPYMSPSLAASERAEACALRTGATAIRALIGTDPTTDRGEG